MGTPVKERVRKFRENREGRSLSAWLSAEAERKFCAIKRLTQATNDAIVDMAINDVYDSMIVKRRSTIIAEIKTQLSLPKPDTGRLSDLYKELIALLRLDLQADKDVKDALNRLKVPDDGGKTGAWKVSQVRRLI